MSATVIEDLAKELPIAAQLHFRNERFRFAYSGPPIALNNWHLFKGCVLMFHVGDENDQIILGSGVLIGPGIALTACHVVEPYEADVLAGRVGFMCSGIDSHGLNLWRPRTVTMFPDTDVVILTMEGCSAEPPESTFTLATLSTRLPPVGERVCLAGFRMTDSIGRFEKRGSLLVTSGKVTAQYPLGRDRGMLDWPCVEIDTPVLGGMSGGAVFDANGAVCALITSSYPEGPSYASLIWPVLQTAINPAWPPQALPQGKTLIDLGAPLVSIDGPEAVTLMQDPETGAIRTAYEAWS